MSKQTNLIAPYVSPNGTSQDSLCDAYCDAYSAINDALEALQQTGPNGRDYYAHPLNNSEGLQQFGAVGSTAFQVADDQHRSRLLRLASVMKELEALAGCVQDRELTTSVEN